MRPHHLDGAHVAEARGHGGRVDDVGEHDGAHGRIDAAVAAAARRLRIGDAPQKGLDGGEIDLDHVAGDLPMGLVVDAHGGRDVGRVDEAEAVPRVSSNQ